MSVFSYLMRNFTDDEISHGTTIKIKHKGCNSESVIDIIKSLDVPTLFWNAIILQAVVKKNLINGRLNISLVIE